MAIPSLTTINFEAWQDLEARCEHLGDENSRMRCREDGKLLKIFPRRSDPLSKVRAQAAAFAANAERLRSLGFHCPLVDEMVEVEGAFVFVVYRGIDGESFRDWCSHDGRGEISRLPAFYAKLHDAGVYFRGAHLGNVVRVSDSEIGLIDFSDVKFQGGAFGPWKRARNLAHLMSHRLDGEVLEAYGFRRFADAYAEVADFGPFARMRWEWALKRRVPGLNS